MPRLRKAATWSLLTFVVFTAGYAVGKEVGVRRALDRSPAAASEATAETDALVAWYFHSTKRCKKCNTIEALSRKTLDTLFADEVAAGTIEWRTANLDDVWNADAVRRYGLVRSSLVLVDVRAGEEEDHAVLERVWQLTDDEETFLAYVESEVEMMLDARSEDDTEDEE